MAEMTWQAGDLSITLQSKPSHGEYRRVVFSATRGDFSAARDSWLDAGDIGRFAGEVYHLWRDLAGAAELYGEYGVDFSLRLTMNTGGHLDINVVINQPWASLRIEASTDQTFLLALHEGLLSIR